MSSALFSNYFIGYSLLLTYPKYLSSDMHHYAFRHKNPLLSGETTLYCSGWEYLDLEEGSSSFAVRRRGVLLSKVC